MQVEKIIPDPLLQGAVARQAYATPTLWRAAIRKCIEEKPEYPATDPNLPLARIAEMVASQYRSDRKRHVAVLTFNYDDLLEKALRAALGPSDAQAMHSVSTQSDYSRSIHSSGIFIHHLHGYIDGDEPILDSTSYLRVLSTPGSHWSWDCLNFYPFQRDHATLFLGLSLVDPSLRLLLTRWAEKGLSFSGVFISSPMPSPPPTLRIDEQLELAHISRDILRLFDEVLESLSLVPYHVSAWSELNELLEAIAER